MGKALESCRMHANRRGVPSYTSTMIFTRYEEETKIVKGYWCAIKNLSTTPVRRWLENARLQIVNTTKRRMNWLQKSSRQTFKNPHRQISKPKEVKRMLRIGGGLNPLPPGIDFSEVRKSIYSLICKSKRNLILRPDLPATEILEREKLARGQERMIYQLAKKCLGDVCLAGDDKNKDLGYVIKREDLLGISKVYMEDDTFEGTDECEEVILGRIVEMAKSANLLAPTGIPYGYFTFKSKCWKPIEGRDGEESLICASTEENNALKMTWVENRCASAGDKGHKCARRIVSTAGAYSKKVNRSLKLMCSDLREEIDNVYRGLPERPDSDELIEKYNTLAKIHQENNCESPDCGERNETLCAYTFDAVSCFERIGATVMDEAMDSLLRTSPHLRAQIEQMRFDIKNMRFVKCGRGMYKMRENGAPIGLRWSGLICRLVFRLAESNTRFWWDMDEVVGFRYEDDLLVYSRLCSSCLCDLITSSYPHPFKLEQKSERPGDSISWTTKLLTLAKSGLVVSQYRKPGWENKIKTFDEKDLKYSQSVFLGITPDPTTVKEYLKKKYPKKIIRKWLALYNNPKTPTSLLSRSNIQNIRDTK